MKKAKIHPGLKKTALFVIAALLIQLVFVLFLTPQGLSRVYPLAVRIHSEEIELDNSFVEYYDLRSAFADRDIYVLGVDTSVSGSYTVILDYLRFVKKTFDVDTVMLPISKSTAEAVNKVIVTETPAELDTSIAELVKTGTYTEQFVEFVRNLRLFNNTLTPKRKITVAGGTIESLTSATVTRMTNTVLSEWTKNSPAEIYDIISKSNADDFFDYFNANADIFREFLGENEFGYYKEIDEHRKAGDYSEWRALQRLEGFPESRIFCVFSNTVVTPKLDALIEASGRTSCRVQTLYSDSMTLDKRREPTPAEGPSLPIVSSEPTYRFVSASGMEGFLKYYRFIANPTGNEDRREIASFYDNYTTPYFFVVCNSPAVTYASAEKNTAN